MAIDELTIKVNADTTGFHSDMQTVKKDVADVGDEYVRTEEKSRGALGFLKYHWLAVATAVASAIAAIGGGSLKLIRMGAMSEALRQSNLIFAEIE